MDPPHAINRILLPRPTPLQIEPHLSNTQTIGSSLHSSSTAKPPKQRQPKSATWTDQEWECQKPNIIRLLVEEDLSLKDVMRRMYEDFHFQASRKQYNTKIEKWRIGKNVKDNEMRAIIRKGNQRKSENPSKDSIFRVRRFRVEPQKIARFKRDKEFGDNDITMFGARTPSDISCDTPKPENRVSSAQGLRMTPEDGAGQLLSPMQPTTTFNSYFSVLSPRLQVAFNSPHLGRHSPNLALATNSPNLGLLQHTPLGTSSLAQPNLNHHSPSDSPHYIPYSPLYWRASKSPPIFRAELSRSPPSFCPGDMALNKPFQPFAQDMRIVNQPNHSKFDWFESFINHGYLSRSPSNVPLDTNLENLVRSFIHEADTYEAQKEHEIQTSQWSFLKRELGLEFGSDHCDTCKALSALAIFEWSHHALTWHPDTLPYTFFLDFLVQKTMLEILPALGSNEAEAIGIAVSITWVIYQAGRYQEVESAIKAITLTMERKIEWRTLQKSLLRLQLADISISSGGYDQARQLIRDVLGSDFPIVATIVNTANIEFTTADVLNGIPSRADWLPEDGSDERPKPTVEGREVLKQYLGENKMTDVIVYAAATTVLQRLNRLQLIEIIEE